MQNTMVPSSSSLESGRKIAARSTIKSCEGNDRFEYLELQENLSAKLQQCRQVIQRQKYTAILFIIGEVLYNITRNIGMKWKELARNSILFTQSYVDRIVKQYRATSYRINGICFVMGVCKTLFGDRTQGNDSRRGFEERPQFLRSSKALFTPLSLHRSKQIHSSSLLLKR
ncbi:uncharacterized protein [Physcomitrium patens]|uniref:uncharacterized protein n=1 Tax=Physcomitrium patens TaxID=3218 RepID=UPI003CCD4B3D